MTATPSEKTPLDFDDDPRAGQVCIEPSMTATPSEKTPLDFDDEWASASSDPQTAAPSMSRVSPQTMKTIKFVNPTVASGDSESMASAGVDDDLAKNGDGPGLMHAMTSVMPPAPASKAHDLAGTFRVSANGHEVEECVPIKNAPGGTVSGYRWDKRVDLGGRILSSEVRRQPTDEELLDGILDPKVRVDAKDTLVKVQVSWSWNGQDRGAVVTGPQNILAFPPSDWVRQGATVPRELLLHPSWPPRRAKGHAWLAAVKDNRKQERASTTRWTRMGWVPQEDGYPVFALSDQIVEDVTCGSTVKAGMDSGRLPVAGQYGVGVEKLDCSWDDIDYKEQVRKDFRAVVDAYITSGTWTDQSAAVIVLAGGLRPTVPLRPKSTLFFWGPKGTGKSYSAQACMYFWARRKSSWQDGSLPGSAKDTEAYIEHAIAHTPIWVIDDMAPSAMKDQALGEDQKISNITRAIFNNATKGRMNANMTSRKVNRPIAQLIITAENELTTSSVKERVIPVFIGKGKLHPDRDKTDRIVNMAKHEGTQARFTGHVIHYIRHAAKNHNGGWAGYVQHLNEAYMNLKRSVSDASTDPQQSKTSLDRASILAADILLPLAILKEMAADLGMEDGFVEQFNLDGLCDGVIRLVIDAHAENQESAPGASLVRTLRSLLSTGMAHVVSKDDPTQPPIAGDASDSINNRLGWKTDGGDGSLRPAGPTIGKVADVKGHQVILFDPVSAFTTAQAAFPALIPYGQSSSSGWTSVWDENLASQRVKRSTTSSGSLGITGRQGSRSSRITGVPIDVLTIIE
ncbi:hypothetical protein [Pseudarthrobacter niigatensis]|uniref:DUF927 domain-containing protein n=1 Tax=Pseudarthrobacter niigatensis TaxID=369935 RepID=A0AAJ1SS87_9MICC|nr:hypothetical protein [Pseudarthrobacter niigatensis]MDQ0144758.1 hypothetical protein [Pseudarthrobacter niigatensis]MDQ0265405.1 hypothetical protein [Pseudarthrobacter niigatensis]